MKSSGMSNQQNQAPSLVRKTEITLRLSIPYLEGEHPLLERGVEFLDSLLGKPIKIAGGMLSDQIYAWRWRNSVRIAAQARELLEKEPAAAKVVAPSFLLPLIEATGDVEDPKLQGLWAQLLAAAAIDETQAHPAFIRALQQFSRTEALVLNRLAETLAIPAFVSIGFGPTNAAVIDETPDLALVSPNAISGALFNLKRLGVIELSHGMPIHWGGPLQDFKDRYASLDWRFRQAFGDRPRINGYVELTAWGAALARACTGRARVGQPRDRTA